jgi:O-succinylbenzoic acid--CoA ligase
VIVPDWLRRQAAVRPEHPAVVTDTGMTSFAALDRRVDGIARRLRASDVQRVGSLLSNGLELIELIHAAPRAAVTLVLMDPRSTDVETRAQAAAAGVELLLRTSHVDGPRAPSWEPTLDLDAVHTVVFTSGTSGGAKPVVLTGANHLWSAVASAARLGAHDDDRWLACLPLWHVGGLAIVLRAVIHGATVVVQSGFDVDAVARALAERRITMLSLVPTALGRLLDVRPPTTLRCALIGGAAASPSLLARSHANGWPVAPTYGCTEAASQVATACPGTFDGVGHPLFPTRVRIVRGDGTIAEPDEDGAIEVQGPTVTPGYLAPDGTVHDPTVDGWFRTGDLGRCDASGALHVLGRRDDVIVTGGENVAPTEVEAVLAGMPDVAEVAVAGVADAAWGQAVAAWVVPRDGTRPSLDALRAAARAQLAPHKLPRRLFVVDALPRTAAGKVRRTALRVPHGE